MMLKVPSNADHFMIKNTKDSDNPEAQGIVEVLSRENEQTGR